LKAPTGSGKSTRVPRHLLDAGIEGVVWVIQPRRLATRSVAQWVASQLGEELGQRVGYHVRFDRRQSDATKVLFLTPGVALRIASDRRNLSNISVVVLDEFHERSAETDALAALVLAAHDRREGPPLWLMSATVDPAELKAWLGRSGKAVEVLESEGRLHPVRIEHRAGGGGAKIPETVADAVRDTLRIGPDGDILCFVPGVGEIRRTIELLSRSPLPTTDKIRLLPLHGELEPDEQDAALQSAPGGWIHVVVATNVAETSLTLPGVRHVIDSGYVRSARFDPRRGLDTLYTVRASRRSADQRAGRAGRVASGTCLRLWTESDVPPDDELPEICRTDLSALWLQLSVSGIDASTLPWPTSPPVDRVDAAVSGLRLLGALGPDGAITADGREMARMPVGPRTARVMLEAKTLGGIREAVEWAASWEGQGRGDADKLRRNLSDQLRGAPSRQVELGRLLLPAFVDRLAVAASDNRWRLSDGRVCEGQADRTTGICLALEVQETANAAKGVSLKLRWAEPIDAKWIDEAFPGRVTRTPEVEWDAKARRVTGREVARLDGQELWSAPMDDNRIPRLLAESRLASLVASGDIRWKWGEDEDDWLHRTTVVAKAFPEKDLCVFSEEDLELAREALVEGCLAAAGVENRAVLPYLREVQGHEQVAFVERMAPQSIGLASGRKARILYQADGTALVAARIGDFVGVKQDSVRIGQGRISMNFEILAPNHRPVQRTNDLDGFWTRSYPEIKAELKRRYPRHPWP
jgi:ATP-dependent helicase HrpB